MRIGFDLDGVLARFEEGFLRALNEAGADLPLYELLNDPAFPEVWDWPQHHKVASGTLAAAWQRVWGASDFWSRLPALEGRKTIEVVRELNELARRGHDIYFITHRSGLRAKQQSEQWLRDRGFFNPTVLIAGEKGRAAALLDLHLYVDDRPENCAAVEFLAPACKTFLFDRPYNQGGSLRRTFDLLEMLDVNVGQPSADRPLDPAGAALATAHSTHHRYRV